MRPAEVPELGEADRRFIRWVWQNYGKYSAGELWRMTHSEPPWITARGELAPDAAAKAPVSDEVMREYFTKLHQERCARAGRGSWRVARGDRGHSRPGLHGSAGAGADGTVPWRGAREVAGSVAAGASGSATAASQDAEEGFDVVVGADVAVTIEVGGAAGGQQVPERQGEKRVDILVCADVAVMVEVGASMTVKLPSAQCWQLGSHSLRGSIRP